VEVAALTYLVRQANWDKTLADALEQVGADGHDTRVDEEALVRTRRHLEEARGELESVRRRLKEQLGTVKAENADLRRKLAAERARSKEAAAEALDARAALEQKQEEARQGIGDARAETRRLRARVEELEGQARSTKSSEREVRVSEALRARLLLDTLLDAAQGLRRELALPPVDVLPADAVAAGLDEEGPAADVPDPCPAGHRPCAARAAAGAAAGAPDRGRLQRHEERVGDAAAGGTAVAAAARAGAAVGPQPGRGDRGLRRCGAVLAAGRCDASRRARAVQPPRRDGRRDRA
jgi:hypothetical protein